MSATGTFMCVCRLPRNILLWLDSMPKKLMKLQTKSDNKRDEKKKNNKLNLLTQPQVIIKTKLCV